MIGSSATRHLLRRALIVTASSLLAAPLASADSLDQAMDACAQAFVAASLPKQQPVVVEKLNTAYRAVDARSRTFHISLTATGRTSGRQFAKGTCVVNRSGEVVALNGKRLPQSAASAIAATEVTAAR